MNKTLGLQRTHQIKQYEPLTVSDTISDIPEILANDPVAVQKLRLLQILQTEKTYLDYLATMKEIYGVKVEDWTVEDTRNLISEMEINTVRDLKDIIEMVEKITEELEIEEKKE